MANRAGRAAARLRAAERGWFTLYLPAVEAPLFARPGTSDLRSFQAIFGRRQHDLPLPPEPRVVFDLGANVGYTTVDLALRFPDATIVAVEAEASNVHVLRNNVAAFPQVEVVHAAVWPHEGRLAVHDPGRDKWGFQVGEDDGGVPVEAVTVPALMERVGASTVDLVKLDIEGAEHALLAKDAEWLDAVGALIVELHETEPGAAAATAALLERRGFEQTVGADENRYFEARRRRPSRPARRSVGPPRRRRVLRPALAAAIASVVVFGVFPELLGDWPYDPVHSPIEHTTHPAPRR